LETVKEIYQKEGIGAFYRGVLPNMILVANPVINFVIYENLKKLLLEKKFSLNFIQLFLLSSIAKTVATIFTYPVLTIRTLLQKKADSPQAEELQRKKGIILRILEIIQTCKVEGLYRGFYAKLFQTVLYNGYLMITYEKLKRVIKYLLLQYLKKRQMIRD
jgi:adenine nucleotide transporter 17